MSRLFDVLRDLGHEPATKLLTVTPAWRAELDRWLKGLTWKEFESLSKPRTRADYDKLKAPIGAYSFLTGIVDDVNFFKGMGR